MTSNYFGHLSLKSASHLPSGLERFRLDTFSDPRNLTSNLCKKPVKGFVDKHAHFGLQTATSEVVRLGHEGRGLESIYPLPSSRIWEPYVGRGSLSETDAHVQFIQNASAG